MPAGSLLFIRPLIPSAKYFLESECPRAIWQFHAKSHLASDVAFAFAAPPPIGKDLTCDGPTEKAKTCRAERSNKPRLANRIEKLACPEAAVVTFPKGQDLRPVPVCLGWRHHYGRFDAKVLICSPA